MSKPAVSIILPIYNGEKYLKECLDSVKGQTFQDFEVIAVLDGCTDRSEEILRAEADARFVILKNDKNRGIGVSSTLALEKAQADLVARMDCDDVMLPTKLQKQYDFLQANPDTDILGSWFDYIDETSKITREAFPLPTEHSAMKADFLKMNCLGGAAVMFRKDKIMAVGGYQQNFGDDLALWFACLAAGYKFANLAEVLLHYRIHPNSTMINFHSQTLEQHNRALETYGPRIWGKKALYYKLGLPFHKRVLQKILRTLAQ